MYFVVSLIVNLWRLALLPWRILQKRRAAPQGAWLALEIDGAVVEVSRRTRFWHRGPRPVSLESLRRAILTASKDSRVAGFLVTLRGLSAGSATALALRNVLASARDTGKRVVVFLPNGAGSREMLVASVADAIIAVPETEIAPMGFAVESPYVKKALARVGLEPEVFARGRYKTAGEFLVADRMSDAQREQIEALLDVSWDALVDALADGRKVDRATAIQWIDEGPWIAAEAIEHHIIDAASFDDQLPEHLEPNRKDGAPIVPLARYVRRMTIAFRPWLPPQRIAVVPVHGTIASKQPTAWLPMALEDQVCGALKAVRENPHVRGVIVHIDSRGGSAVASARILHEVRRLAKDKPVVACLGDAAASGGYMIAVGAHTIVAQPTTVTGSIGVVSARLVAGGLMERLGIETHVVKRGARADMMSSSRRLLAPERDAVERQMEAIYRGFLRVVAEGRRRTPEEIEPLAAGRVWSGRDAMQHGLVDRVGGFEVAMTELRARIGPGAESLEPVLVSTRAVSALPFGIRPSAAQWLGALGLKPATDVVATALLAVQERALLWCPVSEADCGQA